MRSSCAVPPVWLRRTATASCIVAIGSFLIFIIASLWPKSDEKPQADTIEERVKKLEEGQAGLFEVAAANVEIIGLNAANITNLRKCLDDLLKQIDIILDIIQRNAVMWLNTSCTSAASLIYWRLSDTTATEVTLRK